MSKYTLLIILNMPFVAVGLLKTYRMFQVGRLSRAGLVMRVIFWLTVACGIVFVREIYTFLVSHSLTDSTPLSLTDVVMITGVIFCLSFCLRLYTKNEALEKRLNDLHEKLSVELSLKE